MSAYLHNMELQCSEKKLLPVVQYGNSNSGNSRVAMLGVKQLFSRYQVVLTDF